MAPRIPQELRDLINLTREAIAAVDGVLGRFWRDVERVFLPFANRTMTREDRRGIMTAIDRIIGRVYGATQRAALVSDLFTTLVRVTDTASDLPFRRAVERVRGIVERRDPTWWQRIRGQASQRPNDPFLRVVAEFEHWDELGNRVIPRSVREGRLVRSRLLDPDRKWVDPKGYRLSQRVWANGREVRRDIDTILQNGIREGASADDIARKLRQYVSPEYAPVRYTADGRIIRKGPAARKAAKSATSAARRLARTEISRVFGVATVEAAKVTPGVIGIRWRLSARHSHQDECTDKAERNGYDLGPGVYPVDNVPQHPSHPNCLCCLLPETMSREAMLDDLIRRYGP